MADTVAAVPDHFVCPISLEIMEDPVMCSDGITYEKKEIRRWLQSNNTSPKTNVELPNKTLITNYAIRAGIAKYWESRREPAPTYVHAAPAPKKAKKTRTRADATAEATPEVALDTTIQIYVRLITNSTISVRIEPTATVAALMEEIEKIEGIRANQQRLIYSGKQLEPLHDLGHYSVTTGSVIHLVLRLLGGKA